MSSSDQSDVTDRGDISLIAFLVQAHSEPEQLARLTKRLTSDCSAVFIHIDAKSDIRDFYAAFNAGAVPARKRVKVYWGGWSQVAATLQMARTAIDDPRPFTHFALISGVDHPAANPSAMLSYLAQDGREHINCAAMPLPSKGLWRLSMRHMEGAYRQQGWRSKLITRLNRLLRRLPPRDINRALKGLKPYAGANWWILSRKALLLSLAFEYKGGSPLAIFKTSHCPDESYFQTILAAAIEPENFAISATYADWSGPNPPAMIDDQHIDEITSDGFELVGDDGKRAPCFFVRKFPANRPDLASRLDRYANDRVLVHQWNEARRANAPAATGMEET